MKITTRNMRAREAAKKWKFQYKDSNANEWRNRNGHDREKTYRQLVELGTSPDPDAVDEIIGNPTWTDVKCDQCGAYVDMVVQVGQEPDYDSATCELCVSCINNAFELANMVQS